MRMSRSTKPSWRSFFPPGKGSTRKWCRSAACTSSGPKRHESRRIDNQLRGRSGRQGDPGSSRFYLSLEDDLLRIFGSDRISGLMQSLGMEEGVPIESKLITRQIERAQKQVEARNFEIRKHLLEYDDVMNKQREEIYRFRRELLEGEGPEALHPQFDGRTGAGAVGLACLHGGGPPELGLRGSGNQLSINYRFSAWLTAARRPSHGPSGTGRSPRRHGPAAV